LFKIGNKKRLNTKILFSDDAVEKEDSEVIT